MLLGFAATLTVLGYGMVFDINFGTLQSFFGGIFVCMRLLNGFGTASVFAFGILGSSAMLLVGSFGFVGFGSFSDFVIGGCVSLFWSTPHQGCGYHS